MIFLVDKVLNLSRIKSAYLFIISTIVWFQYFETRYAALFMFFIKSPQAKQQNMVLVTENWSWWRHQMETFSALLAICAGNSPVPVNSPHKGQWRRALMFSLISACINGWVNNRKAGDLRRYRAHYDVIVMIVHNYSSAKAISWLHVAVATKRS